MPMPIAHAATGAAIYLALKGDKLPRRPEGRWLLLAVCLILACLPDADFLPGMLIGEPNRFHQGASHSLFVGGGLALMAFWALDRYAVSYLDGVSRFRLFLLCALAILSHPVLDYFAVDTKIPPGGVPLFWPLDQGLYLSPRPIFLNIQRAGDSTLEFLLSLPSRHNLSAAFREMLFGAGLNLAVCSFRLRRHPALALMALGLTLVSGFLLIRAPLV